MKTIADLQAGYADGGLSPEPVVEEFLAAQPVAGDIGAFRSVDAADVRAQARDSAARLAAGQPLGPLEGIPVGIKDLFAVRGHRTYAGTRDTVFHTGERDALLVARLRAAGAIICGTTHTTELGLSPVGPSASQPTPRNPHALDHVTGGSSSGTGAAVAAGLVPAGVGSDGGGSIRIPAALCGVYGLKPSWQLVPTEGEAAIGWWSIEHVGPLARCPADLVTMLAVMADVPVTLPTRPIRWGVDWGWWGTPHPDVDAACRSVIAEVDALDVTVERIDLAPTVGYVTALVELAAGVHDRLRDRPAAFGADVRAAIAQAPSITGVDYVRAQMARTVLANAFNRVFEDVDVIAVPTTAMPAPPRPPDDALASGVLDADLIAAMTAYTFPANLCGLPAASVPVGTTAGGLPIGLQIIGRRGADATVLAACIALEAAGLAALPRPAAGRARLT